MATLSLLMISICDAVPLGMTQETPSCAVDSTGICIDDNNGSTDTTTVFALAAWGTTADELDDVLRLLVCAVVLSTLMLLLCSLLFKQNGKKDLKLLTNEVQAENSKLKNLENLSSSTFSC